MTQPDAKRRDTSKPTAAWQINSARRRAARYMTALAALPPAVWKDDRPPVDLMVRLAKKIVPAPTRDAS